MLQIWELVRLGVKYLSDRKSFFTQMNADVDVKFFQGYRVLAMLASPPHTPRFFSISCQHITFFISLYYSQKALAL